MRPSKGFWRQATSLQNCKKSCSRTPTADRTWRKRSGNLRQQQSIFNLDKGTSFHFVISIQRHDRPGQHDSKSCLLLVLRLFNTWQTCYAVSVVCLILLLTITGLPLWQSQSENAFRLLVSESVKVLPVTSLLSSDFVHRAFCTYFLRTERVVEMRRFLWWTQ